jgi:antitoxin CcdA
MSVRDKARKKAVNLTVDGELLAHARAMGLNLSREFEEMIRERTKAERWAKWREENRAAMEDHNRRIEEEGLWSDGLRLF